MSATTAPQITLDISATPRTPFSRLVRVEWRKMLDTRGGFWLLAISAFLLLIAASVTLLVVLANDFEIGADGLSQVMVIPLSLLMPVFAILTVTSEWGQRTAVVTFALEPHRARAVLAKWVAVTLLALGTIALAMVVGAIANVLYGAMSGNGTSWDLSLSTLTLTVLTQLLYFWMAFGFAMIFLNSPASIAVFYVVALILPIMVYSTLYAIFGWAQDVIPWVDMNYAMAPFLDPDESVVAFDFVRVGFTILLWVVTPLLIGGSRILKAEVK